MSTIRVQRLDERARERAPRAFPRLVAGGSAPALRLLAFGGGHRSVRASESISTATPCSASTMTACGSSGVAHLALLDDHAELGLSVLPGHRGRGVGSALFERGAEHARNRSVPTLFMHCLRENAADRAHRAALRHAHRHGIRRRRRASRAPAGVRRVDRRRIRHRPAGALRLRAQVARRGMEGCEDGTGRRQPPHPLRCGFQPSQRRVGP